MPDSFWQGLFFEHHPTLAKVWGPLIGPAVAIISFVCSIGNVPLAAVLWNGGISFGGVLAFIFADLIILPILDIYRRYYGWKMAGFILASFYATMAAAGLIVEFLFQALGLRPTERNAKVELAHVSWNYTTYLNIVFLALAAAARLALLPSRRRLGDAEADEQADGRRTRRPSSPSSRARRTRPRLTRLGDGAQRSSVSGFVERLRRTWRQRRYSLCSELDARA